jgi:hypothetical protein
VYKILLSTDYVISNIFVLGLISLGIFLDIISYHYHFLDIISLDIFCVAVVARYDDVWLVVSCRIPSFGKFRQIVKNDEKKIFAANTLMFFFLPLMFG